MICPLDHGYIIRDSVYATSVGRRRPRFGRPRQWQWRRLGRRSLVWWEFRGLITTGSPSGKRLHNYGKSPFIAGL